MKAYITAPFTHEGVDLLSEYLTIECGGWGTTGIKMEPEELVKAAADANILIVGYEGVSRQVMNKLTGLKAIGCCRGGPHENIDIDAATALGLPVLYTPGRNARAVADIALGLMLSVARKISLTNHYIRSKRWDLVSWDIRGNTRVKRFSGPELAFKSIGIVGFGNVGQKIAQRALGFEMNVLVYDPFCKPDKLPENTELVDLAHLLTTADFVVIACALTSQTTRLIDEARLQLMKPSAFLINVARGLIVDEKALYKALANRWIAGAGVDVLTEEPIAPDHPFLQLDNIVITPHIGGASDDIIARHSIMMAEDIIRFINGDRPAHLANPDVVF